MISTFLSRRTLTPIRTSALWRAHQDDPLQHSDDHEGLYYTIPKKDLDRLFRRSNPMPHVYRLNRALKETSIMIRRPALDIIGYLKNLDYSKPTTRFLLYGEYGNGKTATMTHLIHYLYRAGESFIIHMPTPEDMTKFPNDKQESTSRPGRLDLPIESAFYLQRFLKTNVRMLAKYGDSITCSRDYIWTAREVTKKGEPIANVIQHGINRVTHASDCLAVLFKELKNAADEGKIKVSVFIDKVNLFFINESRLRHTDRTIAYFDDITPIRALKKLIKNDWEGGVVIAVIEKRVIDKDFETKPRSLLSIEGWNLFEPCLPIEVPRYSLKEFESCMNFYQDNDWLARPESRTEEGRDEIRFVSGLNPYEVYRVCRCL